MVSRRGRPGVHSPIFGIPSVAAGIVYVHSIELVHSFTNAMIGGTASRVPRNSYHAERVQYCRSKHPRYTKPDQFVFSRPHRCQACISKAVAWLIMSGRQKSRKRSISEGNATTSVSSHLRAYCEDVPALFLPSQAWLPMKNNTNSIIQLLEPIKLRKYSWNGACTPPTAQLGARFFICYF